MNALIARAAATYKAARTATASFQQVLTNPITGSSLESHGTLRRQAPDKFDFTFSDPGGDRIVADGKYLWVYTPSSTPGQVLRLSAATAAGGMIDPGAQFFADPQARFTIADAGRATLDGRSARVITLTPKSAAAPFSRATVWLDPGDGTLRQFETLDGMGVKRHVTLSNLRVNVAVPAESFVFTPPAGVRVVTEKELTGRG